MDPQPHSSQPQRARLGGPQRVLLVVDPPALLLRMSEIVRSIEGLQVAGAFHKAGDAIDWTVWDRSGWHFAIVDLDLPGQDSQGLVRRLLSQPRAGTVAALGAHLWKELREECARMGVYHLLEKGDVVAFRGFLEDQAR